MLKVKTTGFRELTKSLEKLQKNAKTLHGRHEVPFTDLFPRDFMTRHTRASSFEEFLEASPFDVNSESDFKNIPDGPWDDYIRSATQFSSWHEMLQAAAGEYAKKKLLAGTGWTK